jgi:hypothetical protein
VWFPFTVSWVVKSIWMWNFKKWYMCILSMSCYFCPKKFTTFRCNFQRHGALVHLKVLVHPICPWRCVVYLYSIVMVVGISGFQDGVLPGCMGAIICCFIDRVTHMLFYWVGTDPDWQFTYLQTRQKAWKGRFWASICWSPYISS